MGSYPNGASFYGAMDMAGNVWEWVNDWFQADYYKFSPYKNPMGPDSSYANVIRGGGWETLGTTIRVANRYIPYPVDRKPEIGFRCATSP